MSIWFAAVLPLIWGGVQAQPTGSVEVPSVLITLIEQVEVPARDAGVLERIAVQEGDLVESGDTLGQMEATEARLTRDRAKVEWEIATEKAGNDVDLRYARKAQEVARAELQRATNSVEVFAKSVSQSEIDQLRLVADQATLQVEQAEHELLTERLNARLKKLESDQAEFLLSQRSLLAPLRGMVVQVKRHEGEWVQPGDPVFRILRIDRLRVECFLSAKDLSDDLVGRPVTLRVDLPGQPNSEFPGRVVFVSPEINPVNNQTRVWAEIENRGLRLRPGLKGAMVIHAN